MAMESRLPKLVGIAMLMLLMSLSRPVSGQQTPQPIWVTINASALANYPGGDETFVIFAVNSALPPAGNETITDMTLTAPFGSNFGIGLPATIPPGQSLLSTIHIEIPANFTQKSFVANLVVHAKLWNGTVNNSVTITGSATVDVFALPSQSTTQTSTQPASTEGGVSTTLFAVGVAIPSIIVIILLILLLRKKPGQ
jgi:hypothetical protein